MVHTVPVRLKLIAMWQNFCCGAFVQDIWQHSWQFDSNLGNSSETNKDIGLPFTRFLQQALTTVRLSHNYTVPFKFNNLFFKLRPPQSNSAVLLHTTVKVIFPFQTNRSPSCKGLTVYPFRFFPYSQSRYVLNQDMQHQLNLSGNVIKTFIWKFAEKCRNVYLLQLSPLA